MKTLNKKLIKGKQRKYAKIPSHVRLKVWESEDGRCENCKRPMDKEVAQFHPVDSTQSMNQVSNLHLLCVDCINQREDILNRVTIANWVIDKIVDEKGMSRETIEPMLISFLQKHGVIVSLLRDFHRNYWVPRIGTFRLDGKKAMVIDCKIYEEPYLTVEPQHRTRGLPKPKIKIRQKD